MPESMELNLNLVESSLDDRLASAEVREDMRRIARTLPPVLGFQFESRLGSESPRVDLLPRILLSDGSCDALLGFGGTPSTLPAGSLERPAWKALVAFCQEWRRPSDPLHAGVMDVFLEYDLDAPQPVTPDPCVFVDFAREVQDSRPLALRGLALLLGHRMEDNTRRQLVACYEAVPPGARVYSMGVMFPRGSSDIRLCLSGASLSQWLDYLDRIGYPGSLAELSPALEDLLSLADRVSLDIDVGSAVGPKVGFELGIDTPMGLSQPRWARMLERLVDAGVALPGKAEAAQSWMGYVPQRRHPDEAWPEGLRNTARELNGRGLSLFLRRLSHLKLVHQPGRRLEAKIYLETIHRWLRHGDAPQQGYVFDDHAPRVA